MIKDIPGPKTTADGLDLLKKRMAKGMPGLQVQYIAVDLDSVNTFRKTSCCDLSDFKRIRFQ